MFIFLRRFLSRTMDRKPFLDIVVAMDDCNGIGRDNTLPWRLPNDLKFFRFITTKKTDSTKRNAVIIGRKTFETFPKPLPDRLNIVISRNRSFLAALNHSLVIGVDSFDEALRQVRNDSSIENVFIAGGVSIYEEAMATGLVKRVYLTRVKGDFKCTAVWSTFDIEQFERVKTIPEEIAHFFNHTPEQTPEYHLEIYEKKTE